jgi:hypothetical protein
MNRNVPRPFLAKGSKYAGSRPRPRANTSIMVVAILLFCNSQKSSETSTRCGTG